MITSVLYVPKNASPDMDYLWHVEYQMHNIQGLKPLDIDIKPFQGFKLDVIDLTSPNLMAL